MVENFTPSVEVLSIGYFRHYLLEEDCTFDGHTHNDLWELNIFLKGSNEIACGKSVFLAEKEQAVLIAPGVFHACGCNGMGKCDKLVVEFCAEGMEFKNESPYFQFNLNKECMSVIKLLILEATAYSEMDIYGNTGIMSGTGKKLLEVLLQQLIRAESEPRYSDDSYSLFYHKAVKLMEKNLDKNPSVEEVARADGVCVTLIKRAFSKFTGKGVNSYFTDMKINVAKEMLRNGKSCFEVSKALGFSTQAYFSRCFKKNAGLNMR